MSNESKAGIQWIFGYGSLLWRPGFPYQEARIARLDGFARRLWQASPDHRGTPQAPGRVATLIPAADSHTWGLAFRVDTVACPQILTELDERECAGYERNFLALSFRDQGGCKALVYVGDANNPYFRGPEAMKETAAIIRAAHGPSGPNLVYLEKLRAQLRSLDIRDSYVEDIAKFSDI